MGDSNAKTCIPISFGFSLSSRRREELYSDEFSIDFPEEKRKRKKKDKKPGAISKVSTNFSFAYENQFFSMMPQSKTAFHDPTSAEICSIVEITTD